MNHARQHIGTMLYRLSFSTTVQHSPKIVVMRVVGRTSNEPGSTMLYVRMSDEKQTIEKNNTLAPTVLYSTAH